MNALAGISPIRVLCVEDSEPDRKMIGVLMDGCTRNCETHFVEDGEQALDFLFRRNRHAQAVSPDLILLDLNLPRIDGRQVLKTVKDTAGLRHIPVIILTTSSAKEDIDTCFESHANCYLVKPPDLEDFETIIGRIEEFWMSTTKLSRPAV